MAKQIYYIDINRIKRNTAGSKAKDDIADICKKNGYNRVVLPTFPDKGSKIYKKLWLCIICPINWIKLYFKIPKMRLYFINIQCMVIDILINVYQY